MAAAIADELRKPCEACQHAAAEPSGLFHASCRQCQARMLSRSPQFFESLRRGGLRLKPDSDEAKAVRRADASYRRALGAAGLLDADVVAAHEVDAMGRVTA